MTKLSVPAVLLITLATCSSTPRQAPVEPTLEPVDDDAECTEETRRLALDESGDRDVVPPPESYVLRHGLESYGAGAYEEAAILFSRVLTGEVEEPASGIQLAQYFLAKAFLHMGFYHSALGIAEEILRNSADPFLARALLLVAVLSQHLPNDQHVISAMQGFEFGTVAQMPGGQEADTNEELNANIAYLRGRAAYQQGEFDRAEEGQSIFIYRPEGTQREIGGGGGNRTRVRKSSTWDVYMLILLIFSRFPSP